VEKIVGATVAWRSAVGATVGSIVGVRRGTVGHGGLGVAIGRSRRRDSRLGRPPSVGAPVAIG
jgi:hypothetical protein